jgi:hypothetical protein
MYKKILSLFAVLSALICFTGAYAQPQLWINYFNGVNRINLDGSGLIQATQHPAGESVGYSNQHLFKFSDGNIYGLTRNYTGPKIKETLFRITAGGKTDLHVFNINAEAPGEYTASVCGLVETNDGKICGVITGTSRQTGYIFRMNKNGSGYQQKMFTIPAGFLPIVYTQSRSNLIKANNGAIYGVCYGDLYTYIYKIKSDYSGIEVIYKFPGNPETDIVLPPINLAQGPDGFLYGFTEGSYIQSVLFKVSLDGKQYHEVPLNEHIFPVGDIFFENGEIFGVATADDQYSAGVVFKINPDGSNFTVLHQFNEPPYGDQPSGYFQIFNGVIYGSTLYNMFLYSLRTDGTDYKKLKYFGHLPSGNSLENILLVDSPPTPDTYLINPSDGSTTANVSATYRAREVTGSLSYKLELSETIDFAIVRSIPSTSSPLFNLGPLKFGTKYYARVSCTIWPGFGPTTTFTTKNLEDYGFISKPVNGATDVETENLKVTANVVSGASMYTIELSTTSSFSANVWTKTSTVNNQRTLTFSGLPSGTLIYARAKTNVSSYGKVSSFTTHDDTSVARLIAADLEENVQVSPNPFDVSFTTEIKTRAEAHVVLVDMSGRVLYDEKTMGNTAIQLGNNLASGLYFLKVISEESVTITRVMKR